MSLPLKELINYGKTQLERAGIEDADRDARGLYCFLDRLDSVGLMMHWQDVLQDNQCEAYFELIERRAAGEPFQYITGTQEFMGLTFAVDPSVLIPRQDTETMVEDAEELIQKGTLRDRPYGKPGAIKEILDLCCGSGAIGISLAKRCGRLKVTCSDVSAPAIATARLNAAANGCKSVRFEQGDLFEPFSGKLGRKKFDMIISNPPYIASSVIPELQREVREHEPLEALDGGEDGLDFYRRIASEAAAHLHKNGVLMLEIGFDQGEAVTEMLRETGLYGDVTCLKDLAGKDRIVTAKKLKKPLDSAVQP